MAYRPLRRAVPLNPLRISEQLLGEPTRFEWLEIIITLPDAYVDDGLAREEANAQA
jgi:hypothetical protein